VRYVLGADIEIVNKGGADNLIIHGLSKSDAERAKLLIEEHIRIAPPASPAVSNSIADEITKLAALRDRNLLTDAEFQIEKQKLLVAPDLEASPDHFMGFFETIPLKAKLADGFEHFAAVALGMLIECRDGYAEQSKSAQGLSSRGRRGRHC
jgi:Short C-terminal domain